LLLYRSSFGESLDGLEDIGSRMIRVATSGKVTDEVSIEYIEKQDIEDKNEDFNISGYALVSFELIPNLPATKPVVI
jgi:hypothetical protein